MRSLVLERREAPRLVPDGSLACRLIDPLGAPSYAATVQDISPAGLALMTDQPLRPGHFLIVLVYNPMSGYSCTCPAHVCHIELIGKGPRGIVGCEFSQPIHLEEFACLLA